jgi:pimeloyl-ACP methyl ester carboxylesterase
MPFVINRGVRVHYGVFGEGPPLFLHVGAGTEWDLWKLAGYLDRLKEYRLIVNDPRGRGRSDRPKTLGSHRMKNYVQDVTSILDQLHISKTAFWGHSDGARVGFALALSRPKRLTALVAAGGQDLPDEYKDRVALAKYAEEKGMEWLNNAIQNSYGKRLPRWYARTRRVRDAAIFKLNMLAWRPWINRWDIYPKIDVPTLIIVGEKEDPSRLAKKMAKLIPQGRFVNLKRLSHLDEFMRSDLSVPPAKRFLRKFTSGT